MPCCLLEQRADNPSFEGKTYPLRVIARRLSRARVREVSCGLTKGEGIHVAARLRFLIPAVLAAAAFAVPAANPGLIGNLLGGNCPSGGSQVFGPWGDAANYILAPNGGFESGSNGWSLSGGAGVVSGNEPFYPTGSHSLSLPSGSTAMSPTVCLGTKQLYIRMFGKDLGGTDSGLRVRIYWYGLLNQLLGASDYAVFPGRGDWAPTSQVPSGGGLLAPLPVLSLVSSSSARIQITPLGSGSRWQIDDVYIDPCIGRF
jgi:hypothetical protein